MKCLLRSVLCVVLGCAVWSASHAASGALVSDEIARKTVICIPDPSGEKWRCAPDTGQPRPQSGRAAGATDSADREGEASRARGVTAAPAVGLDPERVERVPDGIDPLTGLSADPDDWYVPGPTRATDTDHQLQRDLAAAYYETEADQGVGYCPGSYVVRDYPQPLAADDTEFPIVAEADSLSSVIDETATLQGNVTIQQGNRLIYAPSAQLDQQTRIATFAEGVRLDQPGLVMQGQQAEVDLSTKDARLDGVQFLLTDAGLRGEAEVMEQSGDGDLHLTRNTFTRCEPGNNGWRMRTKQLNIKEDEVFGTARHAVVRMKSIPVMYTPYLKFPVSDERVSGFLFPNLTHSSEDGIDVSIPYYWNLAPNYDATIIPRIIGKRGVGAEAEFRHKSSWQETAFAAALLPEDDIFDGRLERDDWEALGGEPALGPFDPADRWLGVINHAGYLGPFRTYVDFNAASDAEYFRDLGSDLDVASRPELERKAEVQYAGEDLFARVWVQRFQRLDTLLIEEYQRMPEFELTYNRPVLGPVEFDLGAKWSKFDRETEDFSGLAAVTGSRAHVEPRLRLPLSWPFGFFSVGGGYRYTSYDLEQDSAALGFQLTDENPERGVGLGYVDGGLFFERELTLFNQPLIQTLEPRLYYLWQEFDDQSALPIFDAVPLTFTYSALYRDNRFSGLDRIGDSNQVSAGVTTRFISSENGREYFSASVGEIFYFEDRRVTLGGNQTVNERQSSSALAGELSASLAGNWRVFGNVVWDPHDNEVDEGGAGIGYRRDNRHIFNLGFRNNRLSDLEQTDVSLYWPISKSFAILGRWNYDLVSGRTIEGFGGLEYNDCCLQIRLMARRFLESRSISGRFDEEVDADDGIFLQIVFKGLAGFGTKVESVLERGIRGYISPEQADYFSN